MKAFWHIQYQDYDGSWRSIGGMFLNFIDMTEALARYAKNGINGQHPAMRVIEYEPHVLWTADEVQA